MAKPLCFKAKRYGWGWYPVTWQGWLVTIVFTSIIVALAVTVDEDSAPSEIGFMLILPIAILTAAFIRIAYVTGEKPRWRWGDK